MKDRNKILTQILIIAIQYDMEIMRIEFKAHGFICDNVTVTYRHNNIKQEVSYSYEKGNNLEVNSFANYFRNDLDKKLMEE